MVELKILIEGYAKKTKNGFIAFPTTTLVTVEKLKIIVDPGANRELLLSKLKEFNLKTSDIDFVLLTHYHLDHTLNVGLFPKAKILDFGYVYEFTGNEYQHNGKIPGTELKIISTPGHANELCILLVPTEKGNIVVASDNFWWTENEKQVVNINKDDDFASDMQALIESRKKVLEIADWIIPGHGKMFKVKK